MSGQLLDDENNRKLLQLLLDRPGGAPVQLVFRHRASLDLRGEPKKATTPARVTSHIMAWNSGASAMLAKRLFARARPDKWALGPATA